MSPENIKFYGCFGVLFLMHSRAGVVYIEARPYYTYMARSSMLNSEEKIFVGNYKCKIHLPIYLKQGDCLYTW